MGVPVPLVILLLVVLLLIGVGSLVLWVRRAASCRRIIGAPDGEYDRRFFGDVMCRYVMTSGSLGRLDFFDWGIRLHPILLSRWVVPTWEARFDELAVAELVSLRWSRIAVWFSVRGKPDKIGFLSHQSGEILGLLEQHDVPVNRAVAQVKRVAELYGPD